MEIGEMIAGASDLGGKHNVKTCPWHETHKSKGGSLEAAHPEGDAPSKEIPENDGGKLGRSLAASGKAKPERGEVRVRFRRLPERRVVGAETVADYETCAASEPYPVTFAAHHLIPGNESLKKHPVLRWVGDTASLGEYGECVTSELKDGQFTGYNVNAAINGVWLPGPYALSTKGNWPDKDRASEASIDFKRAFALAVMNTRGWGHLHFRHTAYSEFIVQCLNKLAERLGRTVIMCTAVTKSERKEKKYNAPMGLVGRLNGISERVRPYVDGTDWNEEIFTDNEAGPEYFKEKSASSKRKQSKKRTR